MQRFIVAVLVCSLLFSIATPFGVVFASENEDALELIEAPMMLGDENLLLDDPVSPVETNEQLDGVLAMPAEPQPAALNLPEVTPQPVELPDSPVLITGYYTVSGVLEFVQIYNNSSNVVSLSDWRIEYVARTADNVTEQESSILLDGWLLPREYATISRQGVLEHADLEYIPTVDTSGYIGVSLRLIPVHHAPYQTQGNLFASNVRYEMTKTAAGNYTLSRSFTPAMLDAPLHGGGLYSPEVDAPFRVVEILANSRDCGPFDEMVECHNYVKLYNPTEDIIELDKYRLRVGYGNQTAGINNTFVLGGELGAGEYHTVSVRDDGRPFSLTASGGVVWVEDRYGLVKFAETEQPYGNIGGVKNKGLSWALDPTDGVWKWATPNPSGENDFAVRRPADAQAELADCGEGRARNPETNRCRNIASASRSLVPCREGQYRSEETNRCRSIAAAANALKPCKDDQFRNPATNRCKKIASIADLADCGEGRERNPTTNRCRNILASTPPPAGFPVEQIKDSANVFIGWWALGGVLTLALGYAGWEWRREIGATIQRIGSFFSVKK